MDIAQRLLLIYQACRVVQIAACPPNTTGTGHLYCKRANQVRSKACLSNFVGSEQDQMVKSTISSADDHERLRMSVRLVAVLSYTIQE